VPSLATRPVGRAPSFTSGIESRERGRNERAERTHELFVALADAPPGGRQAIVHEIVEVNVPVADGLASRYVRRGIPEDDLVQVARLALVKAVSGFRPELGKDFLVYAVPCIRGELRRHFRDAGWSVRPPRRVQEAEYQIQREQPQLMHELGREPTPAELAERLDLAVETVLEALTLDGCFHSESLDRPVLSQSGGSMTVADRLGAPDDDFELCETRTLLAPLLAQLAPRDRMVVRLRFFEGLTQREVGEQIGVTQMQVSRILTRILGLLRDQLSATDPDWRAPAA
jgi:RNA polymerase sigma-B factor